MNLSTKGPLGCYLLLFSSVLSLLLSCCCGCKKNEAHILRLTGKPQVFHEPTDRKFHPGSHIGGNTQSTGNSLPFQGMKDTLPYYNTKQHTTAKEIDTDKWPGKLKGKNHSFWFGGVQGEGAGRRCPALSWTLPNHWAPSAVCGLNLEPFTWSCLAFGIDHKDFWRDKMGRRIQMPHENCTDFSKASLKTRRQRRNPFKVLSENDF